MGTTLKSTSVHETQPDYAQATETAAALVVAAGECKIFIGSSRTKMSDVFEQLKMCANAIREANNPDPGTGDEVIATVEEGLGSQDVVVTNQAALPTFTETQVAVLVGEGFAGAGASLLFDGHLEALINRAIEDVLIAA